MENCANSMEMCLAMQDINEALCENGAPVILQLNDEDSVTRDVYNGIVKTTGKEKKILALSINPSPSLRQMEKLGIFEAVDVVFTFATKTLEEIGLTFRKIDLIRHRVIWNDEVYLIKDKLQKGYISGSFLYIVLTGVKQ